MATTHRMHERMFGLAGHPAGYERHAGRWAGRMYRRIAADVVGADLPPGARLLDVGTGPGLLPIGIAQAGPELVVDAVDLAPEMVDQARQNAARHGLAGRITVTTADVAALPFDDASMDLVVSSISQHHWADPEAGLREVIRVLRPGGRAWIYDFRWALGRAQRAATKAAIGVTPAPGVFRQSPLPGTPWFTPIGRLVLQR